MGFWQWCFHWRQHNGWEDPWEGGRGYIKVCAKCGRSWAYNPYREIM